MKNPIPPGSILRLAKLWPDARMQKHGVGQVWRIGYYSVEDGLDCIWLVNAEGEYHMTSDHRWLYRKFEVLEFSSENDLYGENREIFKPLSERKIRFYETLQAIPAEDSE